MKVLEMREPQQWQRRGDTEERERERESARIRRRRELCRGRECVWENDKVGCGLSESGRKLFTQMKNINQNLWSFQTLKNKKSHLLLEKVLHWNKVMNEENQYLVSMTKLLVLVPKYLLEFSTSLKIAKVRLHIQTKAVLVKGRTIPSKVSFEMQFVNIKQFKLSVHLFQMVTYNHQLRWKKVCEIGPFPRKCLLNINVKPKKESKCVIHSLIENQLR
jgi:hypothetical protein